MATLEWKAAKKGDLILKVNNTGSALLANKILFRKVICKSVV